jgi:hypothetical protein
VPQPARTPTEEYLAENVFWGAERGALVAPSGQRQADRRPRSRWRILGLWKEVPLCLTGTVSKICWRFYTGALRRRLTRSHSIVGALSMAIYQWDSKSTVWAAGVSSLLWWSRG